MTQPASLPVLVINRATDHERLATFKAAAAKHGVEPMRVAAQDAHRPDFPFALYDDLLRPHFWGQPDIKPGAIGCFLSHRAAWQTVLDYGWDAALVCEDDITLSASPNAIQTVVDHLPGLDVLFANERLSAWASTSRDTATQTRPLEDVLTAITTAGGPKSAGLKTAPGADCYVITRRGAQRLLEKTASMGIVCGVDWAMLWLGLGGVSQDLVRTLPEIATLDGHVAADPDSLVIHVASEPLAALTQAPSVISHAITVPISHLKDRSALLAHTEFVSRITVGPATLCFAGRSGPDPVMEAHRFGDIWDEQGIRLLLSRFPEGGRFVDVGAHVGNHTVAMARLGAAAHVLAIEANSEIHRIFHANVAMNSLSQNVDLVEPGVAMAASAGQGLLIRNRRRSSETMVKANVEAQAEEQAEPIRVVTGDEILAGRPVDAIKIDTSGTEIDVLRGFSETLLQSRPLVLIDHAEAAAERILRVGDGFAMRLDKTVPSSRKRRMTSLLVPKA